MYNRLLLSLLIPLCCLGTSIVRISLEQTVAQSEWIVDGDVVRNWCGWDAGHKFIWTHTEIAVRERWKGSTGTTVTVSEPGGEVDGMGMNIAGMVRYTPGEHVVVFLYRTPIGFIRTVGLAQGKLQVDSRARVHSTLAASLLVNVAGSAPSGASVTEFDGSSLSDFRARVGRMDAARAGVAPSAVRK